MKHTEAFTSVIGRTQLMKFHSDKLQNKSCRNVLTLHHIIGNRQAASLQWVLFFLLCFSQRDLQQQPLLRKSKSRPQAFQHSGELRLSCTPGFENIQLD